jgi:hypothetical protein
MEKMLRVLHAMHIIPLLPPPPSLFSISHTSIHTQTRSVYLVSVYLHHSRIRREGAEGPCGSQRVVSQVVHGRLRFISSSSSYFLFFLWGRCTTNVYVYTVHDPVPRQPLFDRIRLRSLSKSARDGDVSPLVTTRRSSSLFRFISRCGLFNHVLAWH